MSFIVCITLSHFAKTLCKRKREAATKKLKCMHPLCLHILNFFFLFLSYFFYHAYYVCRVFHLHKILYLWPSHAASKHFLNSELDISLLTSMLYSLSVFFSFNVHGEKIFHWFNLMFKMLKVINSHMVTHFGLSSYADTYSADALHWFFFFFFFFFFSQMLSFTLYF